MATHTHRRPIEWSDQSLEQAIQGAFKVYQGSQPIPYTLTPQEKQVFEQAKQRGYILFGKRPNLLNVFSQWCAIHQQPIVYAERSGRYATIKMDILGSEKALLLSELSQETLRSIHDYLAGPRTLCMTSPVYNFIDGVPPGCADFVLQAFIAVYRQNSGLRARAPTFPAPGPENRLVARMEEAKRLHFAATHTVHDALLSRWQDFCRAYAWPCVMLHEARKGLASVEVVLPQDATFSGALRTAITRIGQEAGSGERGGTASRKSAPWYYLGESGLRTITPVSTDAALFFAESIARVVAAAGYFTPVDAGWHE